VIRIRYSSELPPGLNGQASHAGRTTVVYLLPGLTPDQRAATLRRMRQHGRMDLGPRLPGMPLLLALLADRVKVAFGRAGAILRTHPAGSTVPIMAVSAAVIGFLLLSAVSIRIVQTPRAAGGAVTGRGPVPAVAPVSPTQSGGTPSASPGGRAPSQGRSPGGQVTAPRATTSGGTTLSGGAATSPPSNPPIPPHPVGTPTPSPVISASVSGTPAASAGSSTRVCVGLGALGVCLNL
jgi:hypothetical protein